MSVVNNTHSDQQDAEYLRFFLHVTEILGESLDYRQTLQNVASAAVATVADLCMLYLGGASDTELVGAAHRRPDRKPETRAVGRHLQSQPGRPSHIISKVLENGETFFAPRIDDRWIDEHATGAEHAEFMRRMKYKSLIVVPLVSRVYGLSGALTLVRTADGDMPPFDSRDVAFAEGLARLCSTSIGKARLYADAHATATTFQQAALPKALPSSPGVEFSSFYQPATKSLLVGGDWYDAFAMPDGRIGVCVGDVSGHGLEASALMASIRNALRTALLMEPDITQAFETVDFLMQTEYVAHFCTASLGILDLDAMTLRIGSAGHPGPKIWDAATGTIRDPFTERDLPLGVRKLSQNRAMPHTVRLGSGLVVFYTDGLVECGRDIMKGERDLERAMLRADVRESADPARAIFEAVECGNAEDDVAILAVRLSDVPHYSGR